MAFSSKVGQKVQFLNDLDPDQFSINTKDNELITVNKRSAVCNFFSWVIYLLSFTLIPRNHKLDHITREILQEMEEELDYATDREKSLAEKAVRNLGVIIENNGGSEGKNVEALLQTIAKIQSLPEVKKLSGEKKTAEDSPVLSDKHDSSKKLFWEEKGPEEPLVDPDTQGHERVQEDEDDILGLSEEKETPKFDEDEILDFSKEEEDPPFKDDGFRFNDRPAAPLSFLGQGTAIDPDFPLEYLYMEDPGRDNWAPPDRTDFYYNPLLYAPLEGPKTLQDLLQKKMTKEETKSALKLLLPKLNPSVSLSLEEIEFLGDQLPLFSEMDMYYLTAGMIERIVKDSFKHSKFACILIFLDLINSYHLSEEKLTSFLKGFDSNQDPQEADTPPKIIQGEPLMQLLDYLITKEMVYSGVEGDVKEEQLKAADFIQCVEQFYASTENSKERLFLNLFRACESDSRLQYLSKALDTKAEWVEKNYYNIKAFTHISASTWEEVSKQNPARKYSAVLEKLPADAFASIVNGQSNNPKFLREFSISFFAPNNVRWTQQDCFNHLNADVKRGLRAIGAKVSKYEAVKK